jgi:DNA-directed RNA polymerase specialized sigma24 family protein
LEVKIMHEVDAIEVVKGLKPKQRAILALIYAGFSHKEAAVIVGLTRAAVGITYKQTILHLRSTYGGA